MRRGSHVWRWIRKKRSATDVPPSHTRVQELQLGTGVSAVRQLHLLVSHTYNSQMPFPDDELPPPSPGAEALGNFIRAVDRELPMLLVKLLETKHLYQSVSLDSKGIVARNGSSLESSTFASFKTRAEEWLALDWIVGHFDPSAAPPMNSQLDPKPDLTLKPAEIVCHACKRRTAHVPIAWSNNTAWAKERRIVVRTPPKKPTQVFTLIYQCQSCHSNPTLFLVAREGDRVRLDGRSPMELIEVPSQIPPPEDSFFRDAVVAHATGRTLAGIFYLRTLIEQYARRVTQIAHRATGDEIMDAYAETLPLDVRPRMPSFKQLYEALSIAIHGARADEALFADASTKISKHFEIRRALEL
jgi:hypothetical protein